MVTKHNDKKWMEMEEKSGYSLVTARTSSTKRCILNGWFEIENLRMMAMQRRKRKQKRNREKESTDSIRFLGCVARET